MKFRKQKNIGIPFSIALIYFGSFLNFSDGINNHVEDSVKKFESVSIVETVEFNEDVSVELNEDVELNKGSFIENNLVIIENIPIIDLKELKKYNLE